MRAHREIFDHGAVPNHFAAIAEDLHRVAESYLGPERRVVITAPPMLSYRQLLWVALLLALFFEFLLWGSRAWRKHADSSSRA